MSGRRGGFTIMEILFAIGLLTVALVLVAQLGVWGLLERRREALRQEALEAAANVLEAARATPWEALTPEWAAAQRLPASFAARVTAPKLVVRVVPEKDQPLTRRVTVDLTYVNDDRTAARSVYLVGLYSAREAPRAGGRP